MIVADTGPLIALSRVEQLNLLTRLYTRVLIPPAVWAELAIDSGHPGAAALAAALKSEPNHGATPYRSEIDRGVGAGSGPGRGRSDRARGAAGGSGCFSSTTRRVEASRAERGSSCRRRGGRPLGSQVPGSACRRGPRPQGAFDMRIPPCPATRRQRAGRSPRVMPSRTGSRIQDRIGPRYGARSRRVLRPARPHPRSGDAPGILAGRDTGRERPILPWR